MIKRMMGAGLLVLAGLAASPALAVSVGEALPAIRIEPAGEGSALTAETMAGKVTVINFWATWCAACKVELLEMEEQFKPLLSHPNVRVAFVSLDKEPEKAVHWFQANLKQPAVLLKHLYKDEVFKTADLLLVDSFPMTLIVDQAGKVVHVQRGFKEGEKSTEEIVKLVNRLLP